MTSTGERIEQELQAQGIGHKELAVRVKKFGFDIVPDTISKIVARGTKRPHGAREIALALNLELEWLLTGRGPKYKVPPKLPMSSEDVAALLDKPPRRKQVGFATVDGRAIYKPNLPGGSPEIDAASGAGQGVLGSDIVVSDENGQTFQGHTVREEWVLPSSFVRHRLNASPGHVMLMAVRGDSMSPTLNAGDCLIIDYSHTRPAPDGLYVIDEGDGPQVKRLQLVRRSSPEEIDIISDNNHHPPRREYLGALRVIGRVVGTIAAK